MKKVVKIEGMSCNHCVMRVKKALSEISGVTEVVVELENRRAIVTCEGKVEESTLKETVEKLGFKVLDITN